MFSYLFPEDALIAQVLFAAAMLGAASAVVGCFTYLRKRALVGDAVAHAILPGVCLGYIVAGFEKNSVFIFAGALLAGWLSLLSINFIDQRTKLKTDAAIGIVLSVFFGTGVLLLTSIQTQQSGNQSGLDRFIFGKAAAMTIQDMQLIYAVSILCLLVIAVYYRSFKLFSFDKAYAQAVGFRKNWLSFLLSTLTVAIVATGIQAVGVVLMAALLITPAATARMWMQQLLPMLLLSAILGAVSAWLGGAISLSATAMPTGPWIVVVLSVIAVFSLFFSPRQGLLIQFLKKKQMRKKMLIENVLKSFYQLTEATHKSVTQFSEADLLKNREYPPEELRRGLKLLTARGFASEINQSWQLSSKGNQEAARVVRLHRLWELYLNKRLRLAPDHVHHDAEAIEHIITPEIEAMLIKELDNPATDPHQSKIPS